MARGKRNTGPFGQIEKGLNIHQAPIRIHNNDWELLKIRLRNEGLSFQDFGRACVEAWLRMDQGMMTVVADWKRLNVIPKSEVDQYTLSDREKRAMFDEIAGDKEED